MSTSVYVLELHDGSLYVGRTDNLESRLQQHASGRGSLFTRERGTYRVLEVRHGVANSEEQSVTREMMQQYGVSNVRGGSYSQRTLHEVTEDRLQRHVRQAERLCATCGRNSHSAAQCFARTQLVWSCSDCSANFETSTQLENHTRLCPAQRRSSYPRQTQRSYESEHWKEGNNSRIVEGACFRCGRTSHWAAQCYARTHV